jgi:hypothetical protein
MPCSLVDIFLPWKGSYCVHLQGRLDLESNVSNIFQKEANIYQTTRYHIREDNNLHNRTLRALNVTQAVTKMGSALI